MANSNDVNGGVAVQPHVRRYTGRYIAVVETCGQQIEVEFSETGNEADVHRRGLYIAGARSGVLVECRRAA